MGDSYDYQVEANGSMNMDTSGVLDPISTLDNKLKSLEATLLSIEKKLSELENIKINLPLDSDKLPGINREIEKFSKILISLQREMQDVAYARAGAGNDIQTLHDSYDWDSGAGYDIGQKEVERRRNAIKKQLKKLDNQKEDIEALEYKTRTSFGGEDHFDSVLRGKKLNNQIRDGILSYDDVKKNTERIIDMTNYLREQDKLYSQVQKIGGWKEKYGVNQSVINNSEVRAKLTVSQLSDLDSIDFLGSSDFSATEAQMTKFNTLIKTVAGIFATLNNVTDNTNVDKASKILDTLGDANYRQLTKNDTNKRYDSVLAGANLASQINLNTLTVEDVGKSKRAIVDLNNFYEEQKKLLAQIDEIDELTKDIDLDNIDLDKLSEKGLKGLDLLLKGPDSLMAFTKSEMNAIRQTRKDYNKYQEQIKADQVRINASQITFEKAMALDPKSEEAQNLFSLGEHLARNNNGKPFEFGLSGTELQQSLRQQEVAIKYYNERKLQIEKEQAEKEYELFKHEIFTNVEKREKLLADYSRKDFDINSVDENTKRLIREMQKNPNFFFADKQAEKLANQTRNSLTNAANLEFRKEKEARRKEEEEEVKRKAAIKRNGSQILSGVSQIGSNFSNMDDPSGISKWGSAINQIGQKAGMGAMVGGGWGALIGGVSEALNQLSKSFVDLYNTSLSAYKGIEKLKVNLSVISGSDAQGDALFEEISQYAIKSPFGVEATAEQATLLRQSGVYQDELMDTLKKMGDLAGGNAEKMKRISNDYAMIVANGKANMVQLRQLANAGVPIYKEIAKEMGVTTAEVRNLSKKGEITADVVKKVVDNMTSEGGIFFESVEKGSKTVAARTQNLEDIKNLAKSTLGDLFQNGIKPNALGNDNSPRNVLLSFAEGFWTKLYKWGKDLKIGRDKGNIEKNQAELIETQRKLEQARSDGDKGRVIEYEAQVERLKNAISPEKKENAFLNTYLYREEIKQNLQSILGQVGGFNIEIKVEDENTNFEETKTISFSEMLKQFDYTTPESQNEYFKRVLGEGYVPAKSIISSDMPGKLAPALYNQDGTEQFIPSWYKQLTAEYAQLSENLEKLGEVTLPEKTAMFKRNMENVFGAAESIFSRARDVNDSIAQKALDISNAFKQTSTYKLGKDTDDYNKAAKAQNTATVFKNFVGGDNVQNAINRNLASGMSAKEVSSTIMDNLSIIENGEKFDTNNRKFTRENAWAMKSQIKDYSTLVGQAYSELLTKEDFVNPVISQFVTSLSSMVNSKEFSDNKFSEKFLDSVNGNSALFDKLDKSKDELTDEERKFFDLIYALRGVFYTLNSEANLDILDIDLDLALPKRRVVNLFDNANESAYNSLSNYYTGLNPSVSLGTIQNGDGTINWQQTANSVYDFVSNIEDTSSKLYYYQGALDESVKSLENEKNAITSFYNILKKEGTPAELFRTLAGSDQITQDTFKELAVILDKQGNEVEFAKEQMNFENGKFILHTGPKDTDWEDILKTDFTVNTDKLVEALATNTAGVNALTLQMKIDSLGANTLNGVRSDVVTLGFEKMLKETNFLTNSGLRTPKYEKDGKTLTGDYEYAVKTFSSMVKSMYNMVLPVLESGSEDALEKFNYDNKTTYNWDQLRGVKNELDGIRNDAINGTFDFDRISTGFVGIIGPWFKRIIDELNGYSNATDDKNKDKDLQPLWKRIIESNLGLDPTKFTNGTQAMQTHADQQYTRDITKSVMAAAAKDGVSVRAITNMIDKTGRTHVSSDGQVTRQIDWKKTSDNMKNFALQLGQSASITSAYRESVENEVNTLSEMLASMPTTFEDAVNAGSFQEQFYNAFDLRYKNEDVTYDAKSGNVYDKTGQLIGSLEDLKDSMDFAENTMRQLNEQLEQRRKDLIEARKAENTNTALGEGITNYQQAYASYLARNRYGLDESSSRYQKVIGGFKIDASAAGFSDFDWTAEQLARVEKARADSAQKDLVEKSLSSEQSKKDLLSKSLKGKQTRINELYNTWKNVLEPGTNVGAYLEYVSPEWKQLVAGRDSDRELLNETEKRIELLKEEYEALKDTNSAEEEMNKLMAEEGVENKIGNKFIAQSLNNNVEEDKGLKAVDSKMEDLQKYLDVQSIVDSLNYMKRLKSGYLPSVMGATYSDGSMSFLGEKYSSGRYGVGSEQIPYIAQGYGLTLENLFRSREEGGLGEGGARSLGKLIGDDKAGRLWQLYNTEGGTETEEWRVLVEEAAKADLALQQTAEKIDAVKGSLSTMWDGFATDMIVKSFETIGASIRSAFDPLTDASTVWENLGKSFVNAVKDMTGKMGELMITAGLTQLIEGDKGMGIALLAAGGLSSIISGMMDTKDDDTDERIKKLENLKSDLKDLIAQAKADAIYYETNLKSKNALSANQAVASGYKSVNDAIITPSGNVISTHPDDYLIATKTPQSLVGNQAPAQPVVNLNITNNSGQKVDIQQTTTSSNGELNIEAVIESVVNKGLATGSFDGGMNAREQRIKGNSVYM